MRTKKILAGMIAAVMVIQALPIFAAAQEDVVVQDLSENSGTDLYLSEQKVEKMTETERAVVVSAKCGDNATWTLYDGGLLEVTGTGDMWDYDIVYDLSDENGRPMSDMLFERSYSVTSLVINEGITSVGDNAFAYCEYITEIEFPSTLESLGDSAFIRDGEDLFCGIQVTFKGETPPTGLEDAFAGIYVDENGIPVTTFCSLDPVYAPVESRDAYVIALQNIVGESRVIGMEPEIAESTVVVSGECGDNLTWTLDSNGVLTICGNGDMWEFDDNAPWYNLYETHNIRSVVIEDGVTSIGRVAFLDCSTLNSVEMADSITEISIGAFYNCSALTSVELSQSLEVIGSAAFINCTSLKEIILPDSLTTLELNAFDMCTSLTELYIPASVSNIITDPFIAFVPEGIETLIVDKGNTAYYAEDSVLFSFDGSSLFFYSTGKKDTIYRIPDSTKFITPGSFAFCNNLEEIIIPASVVQVGGYTFEECASLSDITFLGDAPRFGDDAYGTRVFGGVTATAYYPAGNPTWTDDVMQDYGGNITWVAVEDDNLLAGGQCGDNITWMLDTDGTLTISPIGKGGAMDNYVLSSSIPWYDYREDITKLIVEEGVTSIGDRAFDSCYNLVEVFISDSVTSIGDNAFYGCSFTELTLPESVVSLGHSALGYTALETVWLPGTLESIDGNVFFGCFDLREITVGEASPRRYGSVDGVLFEYDIDNSYTDDFFLLGSSGPISLITYPPAKEGTRYEIPDGVKTIGEYAFGFAKITEVLIPSTVTTIQYGAFDFGKNSITDVYFKGDCPSLPIIHDIDFTIHYPSGNTTWDSFVAENSQKYPLSAYEPGLSVRCTITGDYLSALLTYPPYANGRNLTVTAVDADGNSYELAIDTISAVENGMEYILDVSELPAGEYTFTFILTDDLLLTDIVYTIGTTPVSEKIKGLKVDGFTHRNLYLKWSDTGYENSGAWVTVEMLNSDGTWTSIAGEEYSLPHIDVQLPSSEYTDLTVRVKILQKEDGAVLAISDPLPVVIDGFIYTISDGNATIVGYKGSSANMVIPETIVGYPITAIDFTGDDLLEISTLSVPASVTSIDVSELKQIDILSRITVAEGNTVYSSDGYGVLYDKAKTSIVCFPRRACENSEYVVPNTVTAIPANCFNWTDIDSVVIHAGVTSIGTNAFQHADQLTRITVAEDNAYYSSDEYGVLFNKDKTELIRCPRNITVKDYTVPDGVVTIADNAFYYCIYMKAVHLPEGLVTIGEDAFRTCYHMTEIQIPSTVKTIGDSVFHNCDDLVNVIVKSKDVVFGSGVFENCSVVTIYGYADSTAEAYAAVNNIPFEAVEEPVVDPNAPEIISIYPESSSTIGVNTEISVQVKDDIEIDTLDVSYSTDNTIWTELESVPVGESSAFVTVPLDVTILGGADTVYLRITCTDLGGNASEVFEVSYNIDTILPDAVELSAKETFDGIVLSWDQVNTDDLAGFRIYRKAEGDADFRQIKAFAPVSQISYTYTYTDRTVSYDKTYIYFIASEDYCGNTADSGEVTVSRSSREDILEYFDTEKPAANMILYRYGYVDELLPFDARDSRDNGSIESYLWAFGDGTTADGVRVEKSFAESGVYTVTLTVRDAAGNTDTQTASITIKPQKTDDGGTGDDSGESEGDSGENEKEYLDTGDLIVRVLDTDGKTVSGAKVCFNLKSDDMQPFYTGSDGTVRIRDAGGTYQIGVYKNGYTPNTANAEIVNGEENTVEIRMGTSEIVAGTLEAERMTLEEIRDAGIDVTDPDNQFVYKFEIELEYSTTPPTDNDSGSLGEGGVLGGTNLGGGGGGVKKTWSFPAFANDEGEPVEGTREPIYIEDPEIPEKIVILPPEFTPTEEGEAPVPVVSVIRLPGEATWLKDFFEVSMEIINLAPAGSDIVLENCIADLTVPAGLTLMNTTETSAYTTNIMNDIYAGCSEKAVWILRGDKAGSYHLKADFRCELTDFDEIITAEFRTKDPIRVRAGDNLYMDVIVEDVIYAESDSAILVGLRNEDSEPYYMPNIELENVSKKGRTYKTSGNEKTYSNLDTLYPGEEIWFEYVIERENFSEVLEEKESDYYLINQVAKFVDGVPLQTTFQTVAPYTISGDRVEVYYIDAESGVEYRADYIDIEKDSLITARMPDLVIKTYRLIDEEYQLASMEFTVTDPLREEEDAGDETFSGKTGEDGIYRLSGYDIVQLVSKKNYTIRVQSERAPAVEIPVTVAGDLGTGDVTVTVYEFDGETRTVISKASVTLGDDTLKTNAEGMATFEKVENGRKEITIKADGYFDYQDTVKIKDKTCLDIRLMKETPGSSIYDIKTNLNPYGNIVIIPEDMLCGNISYKLKSKIASDEVFHNYRYKIVHMDGTSREGVFTDDVFTQDITEMRHGSKISFAVETSAGISEYTQADVTIVSSLSILTGAASKLQNITPLIGYKLRFRIDNEFLSGLLKCLPTSKQSLVDEYRNFNGDAAVSKKISEFLSNTKKSEVSFEQQKIYALEAEFDFSKGEYSIAGRLGKKSIFTYVVDGKEKDVSNSETGKTSSDKVGQSSGDIAVKFRIRYDTEENCWKWNMGVEHRGTFNTKPWVNYIPLGYGFSLNFQVDIGARETLDIRLPDIRIGQNDDANAMRDSMVETLNNSIDPSEAGIGIKGDVTANIYVYEKIVDDWLHKAGVYFKIGGGVDYLFPAEFDFGLVYELGWEARLLMFYGRGIWKEKRPSDNEAQTLSAYTARALAAAEDTTSDTYSIVAAPASVRWNSLPADNVLQSEVFADAHQQIVTLDNGTRLMVFADTDASFDRNNPVKLKYSVNTDGTWSEPGVVCTDATVDLQPSLIAVGSRAVLVWQDMGKELGSLGTMSVEEIRELYTNTEIRIAEFDGSGWSDPVIVSDLSCLVYAPAAASDGQTTMVAWLVNEDNIESPSADHPNAVWYALIDENGGITSGRLTDAYSAVSNLNLSVADSGYILTCTAVNADGKNIAYKCSYENGIWGMAEQISNVETDTLALTTDEDGDIYYIMDGRLYCAGSERNKVLAVSDTLNGAQEFSVLEHSGRTFFAWVSNGSAERGMYLCYMDETGAVSDPVKIKTGETERYDTPVLAPNGEDSILAVYLTAAEDEEYPDDYVLNYTLNCASIDLERDISVDEVSHSQPLYAGAEVTTSFICENIGLLSVSDVTASIYDADRNLVAAADCSGLADAIIWTVPETYDGEVYTLKVVPADGQDADETDNTVSIDYAFTDLEALDVTYIGENGEDTSLILSLKNNGLVTSREVTAVVTDRMTDTVLAEISLGDIAGGAETDYRISVNRGDYTDLVVTISSEGYDLSLDNNKEYLMIESEITIIKQPVEGTVRITAPAAVYRDEIFTAEIVLENTFPAKALALSDFVVTPGCVEILDMEWILPDSVIHAIDLEIGTAVIAYDEAMDMNGSVLRLTLRAGDVDEATVCKILCSAVLEIDGVRTEVAVRPGTVEVRDYLSGDTDGDNAVTSADAIYFLRYTILPERYPLNGAGFDYNGDSSVNVDDAVYLLYHTLMPEKYPIEN